MKVAITSSGNSLNETIDSRFGRCNYFFVYDTETKIMEFIPNSNKDKQEGSGPAAVELLAAKKVEKIISGDFGIKVKPLLDRLKIQMIVLKDSEKTLQDIVSMLHQ
jgi:predicted Fe-Mo cluster-binding NifX family protein